MHTKPRTEETYSLYPERVVYEKRRETGIIDLEYTVSIAIPEYATPEDIAGKVKQYKEVIENYLSKAEDIQDEIIEALEKLKSLLWNKPLYIHPASLKPAVKQLVEEELPDFEETTIDSTYTVFYTFRINDEAKMSISYILSEGYLEQ